jgi:hypothetical protein
MKLTNLNIYNYAQKLNSAFTENKQYLPAKVNFFIQKNAATLTAAAKIIEQSRISIIQHYGDTDEATGNIQVPQDKLSEASKELEDLFNIEQELNISMINIDAFGDIELSIEQMNAIMFMVEGE